MQHSQAERSRVALSASGCGGVTNMAIATRLRSGLPLTSPPFGELEHLWPLSPPFQATLNHVRKYFDDDSWVSAPHLEEICGLLVALAIPRVCRMVASKISFQGKQNDAPQIASQCFLKYHADAARLLEMVSAMPDCPKIDFLKNVVTNHLREAETLACGYMENARAGLTSLHTARTEMTNASIFKKIDACDELDGNTLLELRKGGLAKMVREIYQTAKHYMEMLDTFQDLTAQGMASAWRHSVFAKYQEIKDTVAVEWCNMHVVASCVAIQAISTKMSGTRKGKVAEVKPLIDSFLISASERCEKVDLAPEAWLGVERHVQRRPRVSANSILEFVGQATLTTRQDLNAG